jgi:hypothetical protein
MNTYKHKKAVEFLNDQFWHDSILYEVRVIRRDSLDQAKIFLKLLTDADGWESRNTTFQFNDCYYIETKMHGGVDAMSDGEMISEASANLSNAFIDQVCELWIKSKMHLPELFHISIVLASTGSEIDIVCKSVTVDMESDIQEHSAPPPIYPTR